MRQCAKGILDRLKKIVDRLGRCRERDPLDVSRLSDAEFIRIGYQLLLKRDPDPAGLQLYLTKISNGEMPRDDFILSLVHSEECCIAYDRIDAYRFFLDKITAGNVELFLPFVKDEPLKDIQLNELANPEKWINSKWIDLARDLEVVSVVPQNMHRKVFEWVQTLFGLEILGKIHKQNIALGVGTGHEVIVYWMARHFRKVYATDLFRGEWIGAGSREGDPSVLKEPEKYQPFCYPKENLVFLPMNGCELAWQDEVFDVVFSLSSIEHFGSKQNAAKAMKEVERVLKPGGIAVIATEYILNERDHTEYFNERDLLEFVVQPPGRMKLVQNIAFQIPRIFLDRPVKVPSERYRTPHMSLTDGSATWTSIVLFFEKRPA
jgi:SAM-dependent methyltransferase